MKDRTCNTSSVGSHRTASAAGAAPARWRKSSYSNHESACVEMARIDHETLAFRDSKDPDGPILTFSVGEALSFVSAAGRGDLATR